MEEYLNASKASGQIAFWPLKTHFVHDTGCALTRWKVSITLEMHVILLDQECETGAL